MAFTIERIKSFLAKRRLPQFGHEANKDTYSVSLVLFQLWEHDKHFIYLSFSNVKLLSSTLIVTLFISISQDSYSQPSEL
jgi:hypothetical protein